MPTHEHATTVDLAIASVLGQTFEDLELVVIGDGASPAVTRAVESCARDPRVRFVEVPKTASRAERVRHEVITASTAPYVCYTGDDDVLLPDHLQSTVARLEEVDFTHPLPVFIDGDGNLRWHPTDLADRRCRDWHLRPGQNAVSLTGVGHRRESYLRLPTGWEEPPPGWWSDHYMWVQWLADSRFAFSTGDRVTTLKFDASVRRQMDPAQRRAEIDSWLLRAADPGFDSWLRAAAAEAVRRAGIDMCLEASRLARLLAVEGQPGGTDEERGQLDQGFTHGPAVPVGPVTRLREAIRRRQHQA